MSGRRELLLAGAGAMAAALVRPAAASAGVGDVAAVSRLIRLEDAAAAAYEIAGAATGHRLLARIAGQDSAHAHALRVILEALTVPPPHHHPGAERDDPAAARLAAATAREPALRAAIALERRLARAYIGAAGAVAQPGAVSTVASILAGHAQQTVALRIAAGLPALDEPWVSGT